MSHRHIDGDDYIYGDDVVYVYDYDYGVDVDYVYDFDYDTGVDIDYVIDFDCGVDVDYVIDFDSGVDIDYVYDFDSGVVYIIDCGVGDRCDIGVDLEFGGDLGRLPRKNRNTDNVRNINNYVCIYSSTIRSPVCQGPRTSPTKKPEYG